MLASPTPSCTACHAVSPGVIDTVYLLASCAPAYSIPTSIVEATGVGVGLARIPVGAWFVGVGLGTGVSEGIGVGVDTGVIVGVGVDETDGGTWVGTIILLIT